MELTILIEVYHLRIMNVTLKSNCLKLNGDHRVSTEELDLINPNYRILAFDPGGTTGWAMYSALKIPGRPYPWGNELWTCGQMSEPNHHQQLEQFLGMSRVQYTTIVCETFDDLATGHHVDPIAGEYIGVIKGWCEEDGVPLKMQRPGVAKPFTKDINLKRLDLWQGKAWGHAMDAYRHLLWYMIHGEPNRHDLLKIGWPND
jgi:hypothetical protein